MAPATHELIFLTNAAASNVRGRPDRDSTWLGIPSVNVYGEVTIKKEYNASFSVVILKEGVPTATVLGATCVRTVIDIGMYEEGYYADSLFLQNPATIRISSPDGVKKVIAAGGLIQARDAQTLIVHADGILCARRKKESRSQTLRELRQLLEGAMSTLDSLETSDHEKALAKQVGESMFAAFADAAMK
ncbi:hypothetical protein PC9H_009995 [Pleurotus ostreatus]|uniref:Uncharacterized protein n=1 Tax=Pleurotus ostreatus TaxID=5322 RepID=A0A8H6ZJE8_PLEOS|nr:uncharacterized protein PC9H_011775 [Pleurotus ostreatus]XP_036628878.1 uncharacterized protein PC9H_009995 [Pleurotus ostreatus]KAF7421254.1 hypothetical protein PC9H_011775 [Pleurotus ostreatus]KAF7424684.1 hypothetical protein PC9H_009995 [Pleurotus ostreatus]KAJ8692327.1 hypothetical protein PTI98_009652 [Pleurotus ostreatus]